MKRLLLCPALLVAAAALSPAQVLEAGMFGGVNRTSNNNIGTLSTDPTVTDQVKIDGSWKLGFRLTVNSGRITGHEFGYAYNRSQLIIPGSTEQGMAIHQGMYNFLLYGLPEGSRIRPFVTGGGHFNNYVPPGSSAASGGGNTKFGFNYGGGIKVKISSMFLIRLDFRQYQTGKPFSLPNASGLFRQNEISAGFSLAL